VALTFHHINPNEKVDAVSRMVVSGRPWIDIQREIDKCEIMCANCHHELEMKIRGRERE
jgi:hypothetical protein